MSTSSCRKLGAAVRIDPAIAQLRRDPAPQLHAQAALEAVRDDWLHRVEVKAVIDDLTAFGNGAALSDCARLDDALHDAGLARRIVDALVQPMVGALRGYPLGHVPFRHQFSPGLMVMQLAAAGRAALSLVCYEAAERGSGAVARTVCFGGGERHELCLAGAADARFFEVLAEDPHRADLDCDHRRIAAGDAMSFIGARHTKIVDRPLGRLVMLRLSRSDVTPVAAREFRIESGALVHRASGDRAESRDEMAAAVLAAMGCARAAPVLAEIARGEASEHFRWQALRQALALDTAVGFSALTDIAGSQLDELAAPAGALRASLIERYPVLAGLELSCR